MTNSVLSMLDEIGEVNQVLGSIKNISLTKAISVGLKHNLLFISMLDVEDCNIYNHLQMKEIAKEIVILGQYLSNDDQQELRVLKNAIDKCISEGEYTYLKICNISKQDEIYAPFQQFFE